MEEPKLIVPKAISDDYPPAGVKVAPGTYTVRLRVGTRNFEAAARVEANPRAPATAADLERQAALLATVHQRLAETHDLVRRIRDVKTQLHDVAERAGLLGEGMGLRGSARRLSGRLDGVAEKRWDPELQADADPLGS